MKYPLFRAMLALALVGLMPLGLAGCARVPAALTTQTPAQVTTLAEAEEAATIAVDAADAYVKSGASTPAQRATIRQLAGVIGSDALALQQARDTGQPLVFGAINAALSNFATFRASN